MSELQMEHLSDRLARRSRSAGALAEPAARPACKRRRERLPLWIGLTVALAVSVMLWGLLLVGAAHLIARFF